MTESYWRRFGRRREAKSHAIAVSGLARPGLEARDNETLVAALLRQDVAVRHLCLAGECGSCKCRLISGRVKLKRDISARVTDAQLAKGVILACQSVPLSDVELLVPGIGERKAEAAE